MNSSTPFPPHRSSSSHFAGPSDKQKELLHDKTQKIRKKYQSSASLFWDWRRDVKNSVPPRNAK